jgi:broad specificity phosphatase PhoE
MQKRSEVMITLTPEQARVLAETAESPLRVVDSQTQDIYFLVSGAVYARAQALLEEEQDVLGMYPLLAELDPGDWQDRAEQ